MEHSKGHHSILMEGGREIWKIENFLQGWGFFLLLTQFENCVTKYRRKSYWSIDLDFVTCLLKKPKHFTKIA